MTTDRRNPARDPELEPARRRADPEPEAGSRDPVPAVAMCLRNIGSQVGDAVALRDALHIMLMRATPPI